MQNDSKVNKLLFLFPENPSKKNISTTEIDTRLLFLPDSLAKSLNFTWKEGSKGQKPYTIEKLSSHTIYLGP